MEKRPQKQILLFLFFLLLSLLLILFDNFGILRPIRGGIEKLAIPVELFFYQAKQKFSLPFFRKEACLGDEGKERELAVNQNALSTCQEENEAMRRLLGAPLPPSWRFLPAKVIGSPDGLLINVGTSSKVRPGMAVVSENVFIGRISWVGENLARVTLPANSESRLPVLVRSQKEIGVKARGLLRGEGGKAILDQVLQEESISEGDLVLTGGEENYPPDLLIGKIVEVQRQEAELFQKAVVEPLVDYQNLINVFVITSQ